MKNFFRPKNNCRGFTLIEVMVSVAIVGIIASVVVYNHGKFDSDLEINNAAYRMALSIRQAQVYGISARQVVGADTQSGEDISFKLPYGVHFNNPFESNNSNKYIFFADGDNSNKRYTPATGSDDIECVGSSECIEQTIIGRGIEIAGFYGSSDGSEWHNLPNNIPNLYAVDIVFERPNPDAIFNFYSNYSPGGGNAYGTLSNNCGGGSGACHGVAVCIASPHGRKKRVVVLSTGQISVEDVGTNDICSDPTSGPGNGDDCNGNSSNCGFGEE